MSRAGRVRRRLPLALLPGVLCDGSLWRHQAKCLADIAEVRIADFTTQDTMAAMARTVLDAMPERFAMAGLSMGGAVALEVMRQAPQRVDRLALLDTTARADDEERTRQRKSSIALADQGRFKGVTQRLLPILVHQDRLADQDLVEVVFAMAERVGRKAYLNQQKALMARPDYRRDLVRYDCPCLILCGRQDVLTPLDLHTEMAAALAHARLVVVEDCGHLSTLERPEAVSAAMRAWLTV